MCLFAYVFLICGALSSQGHCTISSFLTKSVIFSQIFPTIQHSHSSMFKYFLDTSSPFKSIFFLKNSGLSFHNYHMTPKVWFLIANHQQLQTPPNPSHCVLSITLLCLSSLALTTQQKWFPPFLKSSTTFSSISPSLSSPLPRPTENYTFPNNGKKSLPLFIWLQQWLFQLMLNLCGYINDRHCPWMPCTLFFLHLSPSKAQHSAEGSFVIGTSW